MTDAHGSPGHRPAKGTVIMFYGKVRVEITTAPRHIVIFENGKRTRVFPVVVGAR